MKISVTLTVTTSIIIIIYHEWGLNRPVSASSKNPYKSLPSRPCPFGLVSALFLASCCSLLLNVVANFICIFLVSIKWFYYQLFQNFFIPFVVKKGVPCCPSEKLHLYWCQSGFFFFARVKILLPYSRMETSRAWYTFILENFWTEVGLKGLLRIPSIWENFASFCWISFSFLYCIPTWKYNCYRAHILTIVSLLQVKHWGNGSLKY